MLKHFKLRTNNEYNTFITNNNNGYTIDNSQITFINESNNVYFDTEYIKLNICDIIKLIYNLTYYQDDSIIKYLQDENNSTLLNKQLQYNYNKHKDENIYYIISNLIIGSTIHFQLFNKDKFTLFNNKTIYELTGLNNTDLNDNFINLVDLNLDLSLWTTVTFKYENISFNADLKLIFTNNMYNDYTIYYCNELEFVDGTDTSLLEDELNRYYKLFNEMFKNNIVLLINDTEQKFAWVNNDGTYSFTFDSFDEITFSQNFSINPDNISMLLFNYELPFYHSILDLIINIIRTQCLTSYNRHVDLSIFDYDFIDFDGDFTKFGIDASSSGGLENIWNILKYRKKEYEEDPADLSEDTLNSIEYKIIKALYPNEITEITLKNIYFLIPRKLFQELLTIYNLIKK